MIDPFGAEYALFYDLLYADKDYESECEALERLMRSHSTAAVRSVLDMGCGTGGHAIPLARRGYAITGVDRSPAMIRQARAKASRVGLAAPLTPPVFYEGDLRTVDMGRVFDAVLMMFAVLGYQVEDRDVHAALANARRHLRPGGVLLFDVWHGPAVELVGPSDRTKSVPVDGGQLERRATAGLVAQGHLCRVHYSLTRTRNGGTDLAGEETHTVRYFFPVEIDEFLDSAGFSRLAMSHWPNPKAEPGPDSWSVLYVSQAAEGPAVEGPRSGARQ